MASKQHLSAIPTSPPPQKALYLEMILATDNIRCAIPVMKTTLVDIYMEFSTTLVAEADKLWRSGDGRKRLSFISRGWSGSGSYKCSVLS